MITFMSGSVIYVNIYILITNYFLVCKKFRLRLAGRTPNRLIFMRKRKSRFQNTCVSTCVRSHEIMFFTKKCDLIYVFTYFYVIHVIYKYLH